MTGMRIAGVCLTALLLAGCNTLGGSIGGTLSGGLVGTVVGKDLDARAQRAGREAEYRALEYGKTGTPVAWKSGDAKGEVVPGASYKVNAFDCRDYTHTVTVGTTPAQSARGTACRQASGVWQPVS